MLSSNQAIKPSVDENDKVINKRMDSPHVFAICQTSNISRAGQHQK